MSRQGTGLSGGAVLVVISLIEADSKRTLPRSNVRSDRCLSDNPDWPAAVWLRPCARGVELQTHLSA